MKIAIVFIFFSNLAVFVSFFPKNLRKTQKNPGFFKIHLKKKPKKPGNKKRFFSSRVLLLCQPWWWHEDPAFRGGAEHNVDALLNNWFMPCIWPFSFVLRWWSRAWSWRCPRWPTWRISPPEVINWASVSSSPPKHPPPPHPSFSWIPSTLSLQLKGTAFIGKTNK